MSDLFRQKKLRLANKAIIQPECNDLIRIGIDPKDQIVIHKDLLMILPDFFQWCHVEDYLNAIPQGQDQLLEVLKTLYKEGVLEEETVQDTSILSDKDVLPTISL